MKRGLVLLAALALLVVTAEDAGARRSRVARIHRGKIILLKKRAPSRFSSDSRFLGFLRRFRKRVDPRSYNGASLLGLRGIVIKSHGGADAMAFENAIRVARKAARSNLLQRIERGVAVHLGEGSET